MSLENVRTSNPFDGIVHYEEWRDEFEDCEEIRFPRRAGRVVSPYGEIHPHKKNN